MTGSDMAQFVRGLALAVLTGALIVLILGMGLVFIIRTIASW